MMAADNTLKMRTSRVRGFTLIEMMIALAVIVVLFGYVLTGLRQQVHLGTLQQYLQDLDMQGSRIMQEVTFQLRPAILPVWTDSSKDSDGRAAVFALLDDEANGFRAPDGEGKAWRTSLDAGVERIAFVVPVDAQGDLDVFDDANRMEVGQRRNDRVSLDSGFNSGANGFLLNPAGPVCSLVRVAPAILADDGVGGAEDVSAWPGALYSPGRRPETSAFSVIRYVPRMEGNAPARVVEADIGVDLNGDGQLASVFNIGRLQLVHVGGTQAVQPPAPDGPVNPVMTGGIPNQTIDLSGDVVLRDADPDRRTPIFRLVGFPASGMTESGVAVPSAEPGALALEVKVNLFDPGGNQVLRARAPYQQFDALNREFGTVLALRNMAR